MSRALLPPFWLRLLTFLFGSLLVWLAGFLTLFGLVLGAGVKNEKIADMVLAYYPRAQLAQRGFGVLQDMKYPASMVGSETRNIAVLEITDPAWPVFLDFIKSEIAIRKSERNEPTPVLLPADPNDKSATQKPLELPPINFEKIKTIFAMRMDVASAGPKPLAPPYSLNVLWPLEPPPAMARRAYEFISYEELRLDIRAMMVSEVESIALWTALIAFLCEIPAVLLKKLVGYIGRKYAAESASTDSP